jgi:hypothetical protein
LIGRSSLAIGRMTTRSDGIETSEPTHEVRIGPIER